MPACTRPAADSTPEQLRFLPAAGCTIRADFAGGDIFPDLGALALDTVDRLGLPGSAVLSRQAGGLTKNARGHLDLHRSLAAHGLGHTVAAMCLSGEFEYAVKFWPQTFRVALMRTWQAENWIKQLKCDLNPDNPSGSKHHCGSGASPLSNSPPKGETGMASFIIRGGYSLCPLGWGWELAAICGSICAGGGAPTYKRIPMDNLG